MLGTSAGTVHHQRQGTGLATVLQSPNNELKDFLAQENAAEAAKAAKAAKNAAAKKDILDFNPERWVKHDQEIQKELDGWVSMGANLLNKGIDPATGLDAESMAFRKKKAEIEAMSKESMQVKELHKATRAKIDGSEPDKYDANTIAAASDYFNMPISKIIKDGILPPPLLQRKPSMNLQKTWAGLSKDLYDRNSNTPLDEAGKWDFLRESMGANPELLDAAGAYYTNLPASAQTAYKDRSQKTGKSVPELINMDFLTRYEPGKEPFDLQKYIQQGADAIDVPYASTRTPDGFGTYVKKGEFAKIAGAKAQVMLTASPNALTEYEKILPMNPDETEGNYRARATADLQKRLMSLKATRTESGKTDSGAGKEDLANSANRWLRDLKSPDKTVDTEAAGYLFTTPGLFGMTVDQAFTVPSPSKSPTPGQYGKTLVLRLQGNPSLKQVKEKMLDDNNIPVESVSYQQSETGGLLSIPITPETENELLKLHDKAFNAAKRPYAGPGQGQDWSVDKIMGGGTPVVKF